MVNILIRGESRTSATTKMEPFVTIFDSLKPLTSVARGLDRLLVKYDFLIIAEDYFQNS